MLTIREIMKNKYILISLIGSGILFTSLFVLLFTSETNNKDVATSYFNENMYVDSFDQASSIQGLSFVKEPTYIPNGYELKIIYYDQGVVYAFYDKAGTNSIPQAYNELFSSGFTILYSDSVTFSEWEEYALKKAEASSYNLSTVDNVSVLYRINVDNVNQVLYQGEPGKILVMSKIVELSELEKVLRSILETRIT